MRPGPVNTPTAASIGRAIARMRIRAGLTQVQLAESAKMHSMALSKLERGIQKDIGVLTLWRLAVRLSPKCPNAALWEMMEAP